MSFNSSLLLPLIIKCMHIQSCRSVDMLLQGFLSFIVKANYKACMWATTEPVKKKGGHGYSVLKFHCISLF